MAASVGAEYLAPYLGRMDDAGKSLTLTRTRTLALAPALALTLTPTLTLTLTLTVTLTLPRQGRHRRVPCHAGDRRP